MTSRALFFSAFASRPRPSPERLVRSTVDAHESRRLRETLATTASTDLRDPEIRAFVEGNLWMLTPEAFLYFLPAFLTSALDAYRSNSVFASELLGALTEPSASDVTDALDRLARPPAGVGLPSEVVEALRKQQTEWSESGAPEAIFRARFSDLTPAEGSAVLAFLDSFLKAHGADFPFDEIDTATDRHWSRYRPT
jgi:hypothetical protein